MNPISIEQTAFVVSGLRAKLEAAIRAAFIDGKDFVHGPVQLTHPNPFDTTWDITRPLKETIECQGGPMPQGSTDIPSGWTVYRRPDFTDGELRRFEAGRWDWEEHRWQDHRGDPNCETCTGEIPT